MERCKKLEIKKKGRGYAVLVVDIECRRIEPERQQAPSTKMTKEEDDNDKQTNTRQVKVQINRYRYRYRHRRVAFIQVTLTKMTRRQKIQNLLIIIIQITYV